MVTLEQFRYCPTHSTHPPFCYDFHYVKPGMVAIFGDNGSGKSTLAQLMAGWYPDFSARRDNRHGDAPRYAHWASPA